MIPMHLEGYDWFAALKAWQAAKSGYAAARTWELRPAAGRSVLCQLRWEMGGERVSSGKAAVSVEEAVWKALEEFGRFEKSSRPTQQTTPV